MTKVPETFLLLFLFLSSCGPYPDDPNHSLKEAQETKLRVGVLDAPPWATFQQEAPAGIEADLIRGFAKEIGAEIEWVKGSENELMPLLKEYELHIVIGGLTRDTPWKKHVGLTNAYRKEKIFICSTNGKPLPEEIEDKRIGVRKGSVFGAYVKKKEGIPVYVDTLEKYRGLVAVTEHELGKFNCAGSELTVKTDHHVIALPKGENHLLMRLEKYLNEEGY